MSEMLKLQKWAVVGSHGRNPVATNLVNKLKTFKKDVARVDVKPGGEAEYNSLTQVPFQIEVVDLVVNPVAGLKVVEEMASLGIPNLFIQPGAGSKEIEKLCEENGINFHNGCVLRELN